MLYQLSYPGKPNLDSATQKAGQNPDRPRTARRVISRIGASISDVQTEKSHPKQPVGPFEG
jgi:hypothetical protein